MLTDVPPIFRKRRPPVKFGAPPPAPPVALTLVSAIYDSDGLFVDLQFDRAINIAGAVVSQVQVDDGQINNQHYVGSGKVLANPSTVRIALSAVGDPTGTEVVLSASSATGIVAVNDGGTWAGVSELQLPYP